MQTVFVVCEGQTEETFINLVVAPTFYSFGVALIPQLIETSTGHKGGALTYSRIRQHLRNTLRKNSQPVVTTLIDLYCLDNEFPSYVAASGKPLETRLALLNSAFHQDIVDFVGCRADRFLPYMQPYEFEALLFSDVGEVARTEAGWEGALATLQAIRDSAASPEHINDGPATKPAAQLATHLNHPSYRKPLHGPRIAEKITLPKIESEYSFFAGWLKQLRSMASAVS